MDKYDILDYIIQSRVSMESMSNDLVYRGYLAFSYEYKRRKMIKRIKK